MCFVSVGETTTGTLMRTRVGMSASFCQLRINMGSSLDQKADFLGCVVLHASLCDCETCSKVSLCCMWACARLCGVLLWHSILPSNYWCRNKQSFQRLQFFSLCWKPAVLKLQGTPPPTHKHTKHAHTHVSITFMCTHWVALETRQSACSQLFTPEKGSCLAFRLAWSTTI